MGEDVTTITVTGSPDYDVLVGRDLFARIPGLLGPKTAKVLIVHAPTLAARAEALRDQLAGRLRGLPRRSSGCRRRQTRRGRGVLLGRHGSNRLHPHRRRHRTRWGSDDRPGRLRRGDLAARRRCRADPDDRARDGRRRGRRQDRASTPPKARTSSGAFHAPRAVLCDLELLDALPKNEILAGFAEVVKAGFIAEPEILDIIEADVDAVTDPTTPAVPPSRRTRDRREGPRRRRRLHRAGAARDPQLRTHPRSRDRARRALPVAARRGGRDRHDVRGRSCRGSPATSRMPTSNGTAAS